MKFAVLREDESEEAYAYPHAYCPETTTEPDRLLIAPRDGHIDLLCALTPLLGNDLYVLYVLLDAMADVLQARGLDRTASISYPRPHVHHYSAVDERPWGDLIGRWAWQHCELQPGDEP